MRLIRVILVVLLVAALAGQVYTTIYVHSQDKGDPPTIYCPEGVLEVSAGDPKSKLLTGMYAEDIQDGDLTERIIIGSISRLITEDTAKVTFLVFDTDNNPGKCVRYIRYTDYHRPRFSIIAPLVCTTAEELTVINRISAKDVIDGDISDRVRISTLAATENPELYLITVQVINSVGDISLQELPVLMQNYDPVRPEIFLKEYLIYAEVGDEIKPEDYLTAVRTQSADAPLEDVVIASSIDTSKPGTYHAFYTYTHYGSTGTAILTVVVQ